MRFFFNILFVLHTAGGVPNGVIHLYDHLKAMESAKAFGSTPELEPQESSYIEGSFHISSLVNCLPSEYQEDAESQIRPKRIKTQPYIFELLRPPKQNTSIHS